MTSLRKEICAANASFDGREIQDNDLHCGYMENMRENLEILKEAKEWVIDKEGLGNVGVT